MPIDADEVRRIAALARIDLDADEVEALRRELEAILDHMRQIEALAVDDRAAPDLVATIRDLRDDRPAAGFSAGEALANAPEHAHGMFRVPRVLDAAAAPERADDS